MRSLFLYWQGLPATKARRSLDPLDLGAGLIPHVSIGHILDEGNVMRYDLVSSRLQHVAPRLFPGARTTDPLELEGTSYDLIHDELTSAAKLQTPRVLHIQYNSLERLHRQIFLLLLPLGLRADGPASDDLLLGLWDLQPRERLTHERSDDLTEFFMDYISSSTD